MAEQMMQDTATKMAAKQTIPAGYKQTEVGTIPEDWKVVTIDECASKVGSGKTPTGGASVYVDSGRPFIRSQNIGWGQLILDDVAYITEMTHSTFTASEIKENDVLLNITGASIGRCASASKAISGGNVNQHVCIIRLNEDQFSFKLLVDLINSRDGQSQIDSYQAGGNREGLNFQQVRQLRFAISSDTVEQTAIAKVLSDTDALIVGLEQLIAKKQAIKTAAMQQLLTGRTRLPQFAQRPDGTPKGYKTSELGEIPEDWDVVEMAKIGSFGRGRVISHTEINKSYAKLYPVYSSQTSNDGAMGYLDSFDFDGEFVTWTTDGVNAGKVFYRNGKFNCTNVCGVIKIKDACARYVAIAMDQEARKYVSTNLANPKLMNGVAKQVLISFPNDIEEQTAIAAILSDMDSELTSLEQKLAKARDLKQGMMQQLLTGRIRLPLPQEA